MAEEACWTNRTGWTVRKAAKLLKPGERFIFAEEMGGEGEVLTVVALANSYGTTEIETEELDFDLDVRSEGWVTMAPEDEEESDD